MDVAACTFGAIYNQSQNICNILFFCIATTGLGAMKRLAITKVAVHPSGFSATLPAGYSRLIGTAAFTPSL